jgi:ribose 1,5-bisphosphate isomerase
MPYSDPIEEAFEKIRSMEIRGAGRIARAAVEALKKKALLIRKSDPKRFYQELFEAGRKLKEARPTAVSLPNAVNYILVEAYRALEKGFDVEELRHMVVKRADFFIDSSLKAIERIGEIGSKRVIDGDRLLTHCNSEAAIKVILKAFEQGKDVSVFVTETRPRYQGRLTAAYLARHGMDVTLIPDSAARLYMRKIDRVIVGADALAANGAVVNKIGTAQLALVAKEARTRFFVAAETYKISPRTFLGDLIEIEERSPLEVVPEKWLNKNPKVKVRNPAFDVTPPEYIDIIITEVGIYPPQGIILLVRELYPEAVAI